MPSQALRFRNEQLVVGMLSRAAAGLEHAPGVCEFGGNDLRIGALLRSAASDTEYSMARALPGSAG
jgi:hypothetical protein